MIVSASFFIRSWLPGLMLGGPEESRMGRIGDKAVLAPGTMVCLLLVPEGNDEVEIMSKEFCEARVE